MGQIHPANRSPMSRAANSATPSDLQAYSPDRSESIQGTSVASSAVPSVSRSIVSFDVPQVPFMSSGVAAVADRADVQSFFTTHEAQMSLARASRSSFSSLRSNTGGGKNTAACGPRHAAFTCQDSSFR